MNMPTDPQGSTGAGLRLTPQLLLGLLVIAAGVILMLDNLGIAPISRFPRYWPADLIAIGLLKLWQSRDGKGGSFSGLLFTLAGAWLLLDELTILRLDFQDIWPLILRGPRRIPRLAGNFRHLSGRGQGQTVIRP